MEVGGRRRGEEEEGRRESLLACWAMEVVICEYR